jgi:hypothetical protein
MHSLVTPRTAISMALAAICAFIASSLWYSPILFGRQFVALSGAAASAGPNGWKIAAELLRNLLLASVIGWLLGRTRSASLKAALALAAILWLGFPFTLLSGSVLWQNVPTELALIHCGDWLLKILLMTTTLWLVNKNPGALLRGTSMPAVLPN